MASRHLRHREAEPPEPRRFDRLALRLGFAVGVLSVPLQWLIFLTSSRHAPANALIDALVIGAITVGVMLSIVGEVLIRTVVVNLMITTSLLIATFSAAYWYIGTTKDFTRTLTRADAVYFVIGTLSTAGTGDINAISERARTLQMGQEAIDLVLVLFVVSVVVARLVDYYAAKRASDHR